MLCFFTIEKVKTPQKHAEKFWKFTTRMLWVNEWPGVVARFRSGNQDVKDPSRPGRPITEKVSEILQLVEQNRHASCQEIAEALNINHMTVWNHLKRPNYKKKLDVWVTHKLAQRNLNDRITISETQWNGTIFEANYYRRWKIGEIREYQTQALMVKGW